MVVCPECGNRVPPSTDCPECGYPLGEGEPIRPRPEVTSRADERRHAELIAARRGEEARLDEIPRQRDAEARKAEIQAEERRYAEVVEARKAEEAKLEEARRRAQEDATISAMNQAHPAPAPSASPAARADLVTAQPALSHVAVAPPGAEASASPIPGTPALIPVTPRPAAIISGVIFLTFGAWLALSFLPSHKPWTPAELAYRALHGDVRILDEWRLADPY